MVENGKVSRNTSVKCDKYGKCGKTYLSHLTHLSHCIAGLLHKYDLTGICFRSIAIGGEDQVHT